MRLNFEQQQIINDKTSRAIMVLAGPGSGKTKTLVHKIANLITIEQHKPEYFLMLAHSRVAVAEFRERLVKLIGNEAYAMDIMTFHAFALKIVGKELTENAELNNVISDATIMLKNGYQLPLKTLLVLDEYQDVSLRSYQFIREIYQSFNKECRVIAVGDDDQCINNFPGADGADIRFMQLFATDFASNDNLENERNSVTEFAAYNLSNNYRSRSNLVDFTGAFAARLPARLKSARLSAKRREMGVINIHRYNEDSSLITAAVMAIKDFPKNTALLLRSNEEVLTAFSLLHSAGIKARYLADNEGFNLGQLVELQDFLERWRISGKFITALNWFNEYYADSGDFVVAKEVVECFYNEYEAEIACAETHFMDIFSDYLREVEFSEFSRDDYDIVVATMHKAKGKEFANVLVVVNSLLTANPFELRLLYVALTRARDNLQIYCASGLFDDLAPLATEFNYCDKRLSVPSSITYLMGLADIYLECQEAQEGIIQSKPRAGDILQIKAYNHNREFSIFKAGTVVAKLSLPGKNTRLSSKLGMRLSEGYLLEENCQVEHVVKWTSLRTK